MGIILRADVDASGFASKAVTAVTRGLKAMYFFDTSIKKALNDFSTVSNTVSSQFGAVSVTPDHVGFTAQSNYFVTDLQEPDDFSFAMVVKFDNAGANSPPSVRGMAFGNHNAALKGTSLAYQVPTGIAFKRGILDSSGTTVSQISIMEVADQTVWRLIRGTYSASTGAFALRSETDDITVNGTDARFSGLSKGAGSLLIGSVYNVNTAGPSNLSQLRFYDQMLTEDEMSIVVQEMRRYESSHNGRTV